MCGVTQAYPLPEPTGTVADKVFFDWLSDAKIHVTDGMVSPSRHLDVTPSLSGFIDIALSTTPTVSQMSGASTSVPDNSSTVTVRCARTDRLTRIPPS